MFFLLYLVERKLFQKKTNPSSKAKVAKRENNEERQPSFFGGSFLHFA